MIREQKLLADLSRCAWESLKVFLQEAVPENDPIPGAVIAVQTFGDFLNVFCGNRISPKDDTAMENLARYIIRASFSQERMRYLDQGTVVYISKDGKKTNIFAAMEWMAAMCSHIPNKGEQMVRYYGFYSNVSRGKRQKDGNDDAVPCILESQGMVRQAHHARLPLILSLSKDETYPLICPKPVLSLSKDVRAPCGSSAASKTRR